MRMTVAALVALLAALALVTAGCGSSGEESSGTPAGQAETATEEEEEHASTPEEAIEHLGAVRAELASALARYEAGDAGAADRIVGDAYLEEFERVEDVLGERDHDLMEELEEAISTELRDEIKAGAPVAEIQKRIDAINEDIAKAEEVLAS